jgi:hypothetical protein
MIHTLASTIDGEPVDTVNESFSIASTTFEQYSKASIHRPTHPTSPCLRHHHAASSPSYRSYIHGYNNHQQQPTTFTTTRQVSPSASGYRSPSSIITYRLGSESCFRTMFLLEDPSSVPLVSGTPVAPLWWLSLLQANENKLVSHPRRHTIQHQHMALAVASCNTNNILSKQQPPYSILLDTNG